MQQLAIKKYLSLLQTDYFNELNAINSYLKLHKHSLSNEFLTSDVDYRKLLSSYFTPNEEKLQKWLSEPFVQSTEHPEALIHRCASGNIVRSKSEELIDEALQKHKIPYRYECKLQIGDMIFYPDFTIMHPKTYKIYYWEHFGMVDISNYSRNAFNKLNIYTSNGIIPTINLIITFETTKKPLTGDVIEQIINYYFL